MSERDFRGLLLGPVTTLPRLPLSRSTSTASWSMRFSLRIMISGASRSISLFRRLFLLMTLLYRSLRSEVANLPPSRGTRGRRSGGRTGTIFRIIHSGRLPESRNASTTLRRLPSFLRFASERVVCISSLSSRERDSRSSLESRV